ncbi:MAG: class I SAM-dependent methyltransferase [Halioglobus sp.]
MSDQIAAAAQNNGRQIENSQQCLICDHTSPTPSAGELGSVRGNTQRFLNAEFSLWQCPNCLAIHATEPVDMADIYSDYPLNADRTLDVFARGTYKNLLSRLENHGLAKDASIIDFGCGNAVFLQYLEEQSYTNVKGYDPYVSLHAQKPDTGAQFDCVIANDVIEHVESPRAMMKEVFDMVKPGGLLYVGTADSEGVTDMSDLQPHTMRLHQPFHRVILTQTGLLDLGAELNLEVIKAYKRSYMDTLMPFSNYRFLDEFNEAHGHNLDNALAPDAAGIVARKPSLLFYALFGYFMPSAYEPAVLWRKPLN